MKLLLLIVSFSTLSAVAAVAKFKSHRSQKNICRDNDYYCQSKINELELKKRQNDENTLNQFDGKIVNDVSKTMIQSDVIQK